MAEGKLPEHPFISVVMPVRNEARFIRGTLGQLITQDYPADRFEIIVADGMSDDGTPEAVREVARIHPQVRLLENPRRLSSAGRNIGFREGRGDVFLVVDGHCHIPDANLLRSVARCFRESGALCLGRPQLLDPPDISPFQRAVAAARASVLGHGRGSLIYAASFEGFASPASNGAAYRREVFGLVGYVDETFDACEDVEFNHRLDKAGIRAYNHPSLTVKYYPRKSLPQLFRQMRRYGAGRFRLWRKHPETLTLNSLVPALFAAGLLPLLLVCSGLPVPFWLSVTVAAPYAAYVPLVSAVAARIGRREGWGVALRVPAIFAAVHLGLGWGFLGALMSALRAGERLSGQARAGEADG